MINKNVSRRQFGAIFSFGLPASMSSAIAASYSPLLAKPPVRPANLAATKKPPQLKQGDLVGLVAPSSAVSEAAVERSRQNIASLGFNLREGEYLLSPHGYLAAKDRQRAKDINNMFADPDIRAIFCARGGWGSARLLRYLDWEMIGRNPKLLIGYSDATALHLAIAAQTDQPTIHGPNAANSWDKRARSTFNALAIRGGTPTLLPESDPDFLASEDYQPTRTIAPGKAKGRIVGGNLTVLAALAGTRWMPDMKGAILFLEDVGEEEYRIDRMLTQLREAGLLSQISGFVFGQCRKCHHRSEEYAGFTLSTILQQHIAPLGIPAFAGAHLGHVYDQYCIPFGVEAQIDGEAQTIEILESMVQ